MKTKTLDDLKKSYEEKMAALKKEKEEALKKMKAKEEKKTAAKRMQLRKQDAHIKIMIGAYYLDTIKRNKDKDILHQIADTVGAAQRKKLLKDLADAL